MWIVGLWSLAVVMLSGVSLAWGQAQTPVAPGCEQQVQEQYRQLSTDGLVVQGTAPQWGAQLTALGTQVRTLRHQYDIKKNQAELAEQNVAQLLEQLRQLRTRPPAEPPPAPAASPPTN